MPWRLGYRHKCPFPFPDSYFRHTVPGAGDPGAHNTFLLHSPVGVAVGSSFLVVADRTAVAAVAEIGCSSPGSVRLGEGEVVAGRRLGRRELGRLGVVRYIYRPC